MILLLPQGFSRAGTGDSRPELSLDKLIARAEEAPVVKLVDLVIRQAIDERASDIHIEPFKDRISLRYRIDGKLYEIPPPAKHLHLPIISRIKILAKLDIAEKRLPQDGRSWCAWKKSPWISGYLLFLLYTEKRWS